MMKGNIMADSSPKAGQSLYEFVAEDEAALKGCSDWLRSLEIAVSWLVESLLKCKRAEALTIHKQDIALAELRNAARKLSGMLIEGEEHVGVVTAPLAHRMREEMYALQDPLIAIFVKTPTGFASWPNIHDQHFDALLAALQGLKAERQHIVTLIATALEMLRRKQVPESKETNAEAAAPRSDPPANNASPQAKSEAEAKLPGPTPEQSPKTRNVQRAEWLAKAMLLVRDHPEWSDAAIANEVGKHPSTLSRSPEYKAATALARGNKSDRHKGHISIDPDTGQQGIEAYSDDPAERDWDA